MIALLAPLIGGKLGALLLGPLGKIAEYVLIVAAVCVAWFIWLGRHDAALEKAWQDAQEIAVAKAVAEETQRASAALSDAVQQAEARARADAPIRREIVRVPVTMACVDSPAIRALSDGLRKPDAGAGSAVLSRGAPDVRPGTAVPGPTSR